MSEQHINWETETEKWANECSSLEKKLEVAEVRAAKASRIERCIIRRLVKVRAEMLEAIRNNDLNQYDADIHAMRHTIDELLDILVEAERPLDMREDE